MEDQSTSEKILIRVIANGGENRKCKKSKKQLRKRRATAATEKEAIQVGGWNGQPPRSTTRIQV